MDTIAAIAAGGNAPSAIGVVRVSGPDCFRVCGQIFRASRPFGELEARRMVLGEILDREGRVLDRGLAVRFPGPHSYTGEDSAEFHCHGSPVVLREVLAALFAAGAAGGAPVRQAGPGEFTKRAFLNGRLDLTQAEAVADLIDAETPAAVYQAAGQLTGALSRRVMEIYDVLVDVLAHFHAVLDYPDEDVDPFREELIAAALEQSRAELSALLATYERGRYLSKGAPCVLVGRPNVGKSSLLNALAGYERAIVTDVPGTTRDTVEESVLCGGVLLRLIDTAGLRETEDEVERLGVERSRRAMEEAELILLVSDDQVDMENRPRAYWEDFRQLLAAVGGQETPWIFIASKRDLSGKTAGSIGAWGGERPWNGPAAYVSLSSVTGEGMKDLEKAVAALFPAGDPGEAGSLLTDQRQEDAARRALDAVRRGRAALEGGLTPDAVLTDAEEALDALGELTGRTAKEEIVERIFSRFCVGK